MAELGLPKYKAPPKAHQAAAKAERSRRKACHGDWTACERHEEPQVWCAEHGKSCQYGCIR